jgi:hypothetical protein
MSISCVKKERLLEQDAWRKRANGLNSKAPPAVRFYRKREMTRCDESVSCCKGFTREESVKVSVFMIQ